jgi:hypothetical protein
MQIPLTFLEAKSLKPEQLIERLQAMTFPKQNPHDTLLGDSDLQPGVSIGVFYQLTSVDLNTMRDEFIEHIKADTLTDDFIQRFVDQQLFWLAYNAGKAARQEKAMSAAQTKAEAYGERDQAIIDFIHNSSKPDTSRKIADLLGQWDILFSQFGRPPSTKTIRNILSKNR